MSMTETKLEQLAKDIFATVADKMAEAGLDVSDDDSLKVFATLIGGWWAFAGATPKLAVHVADAVGNAIVKAARLIAEEGPPR